jgi:hypothetical protein
MKMQARLRVVLILPTLALLIVAGPSLIPWNVADNQPAWTSVIPSRDAVDAGPDVRNSFPALPSQFLTERLATLLADEKDGDEKDDDKGDKKKDEEKKEEDCGPDRMWGCVKFG